jgi:Domain of unknown function (DUF1918)
VRGGRSDELQVWEAMADRDQRTGGTMAFEVGTRVRTHAGSTSRGPRLGVVEEVLRGDPAPRYRVRWDDGHESVYTPASGTLQAQARRRSSPRATKR